MNSTPDKIAKACAETLWAADTTAQNLGMKLLSVSQGMSQLTMLVRPDMLNGHGTCHGGYIFTLADTAFAFSCNTYNERTVAQHADITYVAPGRAEDVLTASAVERSRTGRSGIYDVTVTQQDGTVIAEFRGNSRTIGGSIINAQ